MLIGTLIMWASQANGAIVIYSEFQSVPQYGEKLSYLTGNIVVLVSRLGFSATDSLLLSTGWITLACVGNFTNAMFLDRLGRVRSLCKCFDSTPFDHYGFLFGEIY